MGFTIDAFMKNEKLNAFYTPLAHEMYDSKDLLSVFEAKEMPIYGILGHPEMIYTECQEFDII